MSGLRLVNVTRRYAGFTAVDHLNLEISDGEFVTLLGPSGCGKTTTLRMVAGFITPDEGEIWFGDRRVNDVPPHRRNTAMVFQSYALFPHMTVAQNVAFGLRMRGMPAAEREGRIREALEMVSLTGLEARKPGQLSGGQQQRVALARVIVTRPDIMLFDEPLSNLDAKLRESVRVEIRDLQRRLGITSLYVTHDQTEALAMSDRIVVMNRGHIEQSGDPNTIYHAPRSSFVADFIGVANVIAGKSSGDGFVEAPVGRLRVVSAPAGDVKLSWRPEDMHISAGPEENLIRATVRNVVFRGNFIEVMADAGGQLIRAQVNNDVKVSAGEAIAFSLPAERIRIVE
jgi:ABC-type Fe3+/spermidine/putrescine transport system ATPase subunit